jgi:hypothetical protein
MKVELIEAESRMEVGGIWEILVKRYKISDEIGCVQGGMAVDQKIQNFS